MTAECGTPLGLANMHAITMSVIAICQALEFLGGHLAGSMKCPDSLASLWGGVTLQLTKQSLFEVSCQHIVVINVLGLQPLVGKLNIGGFNRYN